MSASKKRQSAAEVRAAAQAAENAALRDAMRWTDAPPMPDIPVPSWGERAEGWMVIGGGEYARAEKAWSEATRHGTGTYKHGVATQRGVSLYSSPVAAWRAARCEIEWSVALKLRAIDVAIEKAAASRCTHPHATPSALVPALSCPDCGAVFRRREEKP